MKPIFSEKQVELNDRDSFNKTPLLNAIIKGHEDIALYLIEKGADPTVRDLDETNCFHEVI